MAENTNDFGEITLQAERLDPKFGGTRSFSDVASYDEIAPVPLHSDRQLDAYRVIDVMDHFLCCEATWLGGADDEEMLFPCIYFRDHSRFSSHDLLHSFFSVAGMICNAASMILSFESWENDEEFSDGVGLQRLQEVEERISRQLKDRKYLLSKEGPPEDVEALHFDHDLNEEFCNALLCRLRFHKYFYHMLTCLRKTQGDDGLDLGKKHTESCSSELDSILQTCAVTKGRVEHKTTASGWRPLGVDSRLCDWVEPCCWKEAIGYFQQLLHNLKIICSHSLTPVLKDAFSFLVEFNKYRPLPFARTTIQMLVQDGRLYGREPIFGIICEAALLPKWANDYDIPKLKSVEELGQLLIKLLGVLCTDHESQRDELASQILDWRRIFRQLDTEFGHKYGNLKRGSSDKHKIGQVFDHIRLWVKEQELWIALRYLLLGFDTDSYLHKDYFMVYWYILMISIDLAKIIKENTELKKVSARMTSLHANLSGQVTIHLLENVTRVSIIQPLLLFRKQKRTQKGESAPAPNVDPPQVMLLKCYSHVAEGLILVLGILRIKHKVFIWQGEEQVSEEERFRLNFSALMRYWPNLTYRKFKKRTSPSSLADTLVAFRNVINRIHQIAVQLRFTYENDAVLLAEVDQLAHVAENNVAAFNLCLVLDNLDESTTFSFGQHPHFPVVVLGGPHIEEFRTNPR